MSEEKECKCCHEWWYSSNVKGGLCPNCYYYFKQLKQQLAEKDKEIAHLKEKDNYHLRYELAGLDETIANLKKQLEEKDKLLKCYQEEEKLIADILGDKDLTIIGSRVHLKNLIVELKNKIKDRDIVIEEKDKEIESIKQQIEEKDKEIEKLKQQYTILENENGKLTTDLIMDKYKKAQKEVSFGKQLAIQELEKVKNKCNGMYELWLDSNYKENMYNNEDIAGVFEDISVFTNDLIKKLKGE